jgi:hypothetical protein
MHHALQFPDSIIVFLYYDLIFPLYYFLHIFISVPILKKFLLVPVHKFRVSLWLETESLRESDRGASHGPGYQAKRETPSEMKNVYIHNYEKNIKFSWRYCA